MTSHIDWDVTEFEPSPDGRLLAIVTNEDGFLAGHVLDASTGRDKGVRFPTGYVTGIRWTRDSRWLGFNIDSAQSPTDEPGPARPGRYEVAWDGRDEQGRRIAAGLYFYRLDALDSSQTRKLIVLE